MTEHIFNSQFGLSNCTTALCCFIQSEYRAYKNARHQFFQLRESLDSEDFHNAQACRSYASSRKEILKILISLAKSFRETLSVEARDEVYDTLKMLDKIDKQEASRKDS